MRLKPLRDQVIVITGASSGIGLATARMAARRGSKLVLAARSDDALRQLVDEIRAGAGLALVTSEALISADISALRSWIEQQPDWSDFPFVLLVQHGSGVIPKSPATWKSSTTSPFLNDPFIPRPSSASRAPHFVAAGVSTKRGRALRNFAA